MNRPIILLDIDGCCNPCPFDSKRSSDWKFEPTFKSDDASGGFPLNLSIEMGKALNELDANIIWLTTWILNEDHANPNIGKALGWDHKPLCNVEKRGFSDWAWKPRKVKELLENPGPKVVWIDDDAEGFLKLFDNKEILDPHNRLLVICPENDVGLTRDHIETIKLFLKE